MSTARKNAIDMLSTGELGFLVSAVRSSIWDAIEAELKPLDISPAQFVVFNIIALRKGRTIGEFCRLLAYDSGAMTRLLDRIEKKGLIRRVTNPEDRRSYLIELTPESRAMFPQARRRVEAVLRRLLAGFSNAQAEAFRRSLEQVLANAASMH
ncbi:MAG TPA: MarR family transcriptional regulator [Rhodanobacteraceae bacterium]|jgi:DNA-binding MarR family transcriptional regulator|nr:MarR family transcriptional regulator [Rhodanobacteraceae bacterium]